MWVQWHNDAQKHVVQLKIQMIVTMSAQNRENMYVGMTVVTLFALVGIAVWMRQDAAREQTIITPNDRTSPVTTSTHEAQTPSVADDVQFTSTSSTTADMVHVEDEATVSSASTTPNDVPAFPTTAEGLHRYELPGGSHVVFDATNTYAGPFSEVPQELRDLGPLPEPDGATRLDPVQPNILRHFDDATHETSGANTMYSAADGKL